MNTIKILVLAICFLGATAALAQSGTVLSNEVQPLRINDHANRATRQPVAAEQNLLGQNSITVAEGERPLSEFAVAQTVEPLGDIARRLKEEHDGVTKATTVLVKQ